MFENIGQKIMGLARLVCGIGISISVIICLLVLSGSNNQWQIVFIAFTILIGGILFSWIGSWAMYAFGQFVDDNQKIRMSLYDINEKLSTIMNAKRNIMSAPTPTRRTTRPNTDSATVLSDPKSTTTAPVVETTTTDTTPVTEPTDLKETTTTQPQATQLKTTSTPPVIKLVRIIGAPKQGCCPSCVKLNVTLLRCVLERDGSRFDSYRCEECIKNLDNQDK